MKPRLLLDSAIVISFFILPWWFGGLLCLAGLVLMKDFWEIMLWGFAMDIFFGIHGVSESDFFYLTTATVLLYVLSIPIRARISLHTKI